MSSDGAFVETNRTTRERRCHVGFDGQDGYGLALMRPWKYLLKGKAGGTGWLAGDVGSDLDLYPLAVDVNAGCHW